MIPAINPEIPAAWPPTALAAILEQAAAFPAAAWHQGGFAVDAQGSRVAATNPQAVKLCLLGQATQAAAAGGLEQTYHIWEALRETLGGKSLADWNDEPGRTPAEVKELFAQTAARLRALPENLKPTV